MKELEKTTIVAPDPVKLAALLFNPDVQNLIHTINEQYYYWDKVKYLQVPEGVTNSEIWAVVKNGRRATAYRVKFGNYYFTWSLTNKIQQLLHLFDMNIGGSFETKSLIPPEEKNRYLINSIMEEAIASSQIEGAVTTRTQAKDMLRKNRPPRNKSEQMIVNNYFTIQKMLTLKEEPLTEARLLEIHQAVTNDTLANKTEEGFFRITNDVNVVDAQDGSIVYQPPAMDEIPLLIKDLCSFFNDDTDKRIFIHPVVKGCIIHFMLGYIHPFTDGNGRTARALLYWYLLRRGYWLTEYLSISRMILRSKISYAKAFLYTETDENDLTYFINYNIRTMHLAYDNLRVYIREKLQEKKSVHEFLKIEGINERQALVLKWLYEEPESLFTVKEIENRFAVSNQTSRNDLLQLMEMGFMDMIHINNKTRAFIRSKDFENQVSTKLK